MNIVFESEKTEMTARNAYVMDVSADVEKIESVLDNFTPEDILNNYSDLEELFNRLKEYYGYE